MTAMRGKQGGPGRPAPDVLVDESTHLAKPVAGSTMTSGNALTPDRAAIAVDIQFPPNSTSLSGEAVAALNGVAATAGDLPGRILVTARADPIEQNAQGPDISIARAHTVRSYLARAGVDPQRIVVQAVGNTQARVDASRCEGMSGADLKSWLAADRTVTVQVGRLDVGMADPGVVIGVIYGE
jgi:outer membrane protein OmpA-like peptidoglycan-associated protein